jgi:hypothetical protein
MDYTWEQMEFLYCKVYASEEYSNRDAFVNKLKEYIIPENDAIIMWKAFDMATEKCSMYYEMKMNKSMVLLEDK